MNVWTPGHSCERRECGFVVWMFCDFVVGCGGVALRFVFSGHIYVTFFVTTTKKYRSCFNIF